MRSLILWLAVCAAVPVWADVVQRGPFTVQFDARDADVAARSLDTLEEALAQYRDRLPLGARNVQVFIDSEGDSFREVFGRDQARVVSGFARSEAGIIVMKPPRLLPPSASYDAILRHELLHVLIAGNTKTENLPRWLNEGIAMMVSREIRWSAPAQVARMYLTGEMIHYARLPGAFADPADEAEFGAAYAQSLSMTRYLYDELGRDGFWALIGDLKELRFDDALRQRLGLTPLEFYDGWIRSLRYSAWITTGLSGVTLFQAAAILSVVAYVRYRRRSARKIREWETEEMVNDIFGESDSLDEGDYFEEEDDEGWY